MSIPIKCALERYLEVSMSKKETLATLRKANAELRDLNPIIEDYLIERGIETLDLGEGSKLVLINCNKKTRKSQKQYREELRDYLTNMGVVGVDKALEEIVSMKSGEEVQACNLKVIQ